jgi:DNA modification methylase
MKKGGNTAIPTGLAMKIVHKPVDILIPYINNSRTHSDEQVAQIAASIKEFGWTNPILVDRENGIIAGHGRLLAARKLGYKEVPTIELADLTETQKKAYIIADNRLALNAGWDNEMLTIELNDLLADGFALEMLGFDPKELDALLEPEVVEGLTDEDAVPDAPEEPKTKLGDIYQLGNHRLMCGDSTSIDAVDKLMDGQKADMVFTDPPYGIDVVNNNGKVGGGTAKYPTAKFSKIIGDSTTDTAKEFYNTCIALGFNKFIIWGGNYFTDFLKPNRCWIVWYKNHVTERTFANCELAWTNIDHNAKTYSSTWDGYTKEGESGSKIHPSQKPIKLCTDVLQDFTKKGNIVFDGFLGSGSTLIVCEKLNRHCYGIELDPKYCDVIVKRWEDFTGKKAVLLTETVESA